MCRYLNNPKGFTLIGLIASIFIIGILSAVGIQQLTEYKSRGYDAYSKHALHNMNLTLKAYLSMKNTSKECDRAKAKEYGFVQNPEVATNVLSTFPENFCASAKNKKSPNTYSSDHFGVARDNADCGSGLAAELAAKAKEERIKYASFENLTE
jgi:type II secretory pathway pseudopilin PulG